MIPPPEVSGEKVALSLLGTAEDQKILFYHFQAHFKTRIKITPIKNPVPLLLKT